MVSQIARVDVTVTRSEGEALLLENNFIKAHEPRYNILYPGRQELSVHLHQRRSVSAIALPPGIARQAPSVLRPVPGAGAVREGIATLQKVFQLRTCENTVFANRSRPCMLHQIQRCTAPCVGRISEAEYREDVEGRVALPARQGERGDDEAAGADGRGRRQARVRARGARPRQDRAHADAAVAPVRRERDGGRHRRGGRGDRARALRRQRGDDRGGRHVGDKTFFPRYADAAAVEGEGEIVPTFLTQHYLERPVPPTIIVPDVEDHAALAEVLTAQSGQKVDIVGNPGGERRVWLTMALENATFALRQKLAQKATQEDRLAALQEALGLPSTVQRIECFDISHTDGRGGGGVLRDLRQARDADVRIPRFNVTPAQAGDDYAGDARGVVAAMRTHRVGRISGARSPGDRRRKGQVAVAANVLEEQGLHQVPLIGIAKGPERKAGEEDIVFPDREPVLNLPSDHPGLHLLQQIRDEAHRFAIQGHRARRAKARTTSTLQEIAGIGATRRKALLQHFGGVKGVQAASVEDIARVPGISRALAERIFAELH
jgi:excinuclease ABC subunit C